MKSALKTVTKEEFDKFIKEYPNKLVKDAFHAYEPPLITYNDFTLGDWPDSVVASSWNGGFSISI